MLHQARLIGHYPTWCFLIKSGNFGCFVHVSHVQLSSFFICFLVVAAILNQILSFTENILVCLWLKYYSLVIRHLLFQIICLELLKKNNVVHSTNLYNNGIRIFAVLMTITSVQTQEKRKTISTKEN